MTLDEVKACFSAALREEQKGRKHKGLLIGKRSRDVAEEYIDKAKEELESCDYFLEMGRDYKIPEQWFYSLYYCALAILAIFGVESRSQRCTALLLKYLKDTNLIDYDGKFIEKIMVFRDKDKESEVDRREEARYGSWIKNEEVRRRYKGMMELCKAAISETEEIVYANKEYKVPDQLLR